MTLAVCQIDAGYHSPFRALRLESICTEPEFLGWPYEDEARLRPAAWNQKYRDPQGRVVFGVFAEGQLVGCMAVAAWTGDPTGRTALWNMAYVKPEYRHRKLAGKSAAQRLYQAREEHTRRIYDAVVFPIHENNPNSADIHRRNGAQYSHPERMTWNGKNPGTWHWYRKELRRDRLQVA